MVRPGGQVSDPALWYGSGARSSPVGSPIRSAARIGEEALAAVRGALLGHGIDTSVPVAGHTGSKVRLPLHYFDNHDLERHEPDAWVELANERFGRRANAAVLITDESGVGTWRLGRVFQWDAAAGQFYAHLLGAGGRVAEDSSVVVQRLSCMFLLERPEEFAARVAFAHRARDECEAHMLFQFYVKNMPTSDVYTLSERQVQRLLDRALSANKLRSAFTAPESTAELVSEVRLEYAHALNGMLLRVGLTRPPLKDKVRAELLLPPPPPAAPELGVISLESNNYVACAASFFAISSLIVPQVVRALAAARHECIQLGRLSLFNVEIGRSMLADDFDALQSQHCAKLLHFLRETWQPAIRKVVSDALSTAEADFLADTPPSPPIDTSDMPGAVTAYAAPDYDADDDEEVEGPAPTRLRRMMVQLNLMTSDAVRSLGLASVGAYATFLTEHAASYRGVLPDPDSLPRAPLISLEVLYERQAPPPPPETDADAEAEAEGAEAGAEAADGEKVEEEAAVAAELPFELRLSTSADELLEVPLRLLDDALSALSGLSETDLTSNISEPRPLRSLGRDEPPVIGAHEQIRAALATALVPLGEYVEGLRHYEALLGRRVDEYVDAFAKSAGDDGAPPTIDQIQGKIDEVRAEQRALDAALPSRVVIGMYSLSLTRMKGLLLSKCDECANTLMGLVATRAATMCKAISDAFSGMYARLEEQPKDIEKLTEMANFLASLPERSDELSRQITEMVSHYDMLEALGRDVPAADYSARWEAYHWPLRLHVKQEECRRMLDEDRSLFKKEMDTQQGQFERQLEELAYRVSNFHQHVELSRVNKVVSIVHDIKASLRDYETKAQVFNKRERLFGSEESEYQALASIIKEFEPYASLWTTAADWQKWQREWFDGPLNALVPDEVEKSFVSAQRAMAKAVKVFAESAGCLGIAKQLRQEMLAFQVNVPVVQALRNPGMRERHWDALSAELRFELRPDDQFTLRDATEGLRLHEPRTLEKVQRVCERAMKEFAIEKALDDMAASWADVMLEVISYRATGTYVIKVSDEVNTLLDDNLVLTQQFSFSPYKGPFEERIADWERKLRLVQEVLSEWLSCQRNWMYLQPIFDSEDINRQLPAEGKRFAGVDRMWRKTLDRVRAAPHVLTFCDDDELHEQWFKANAELERVQKNLADYLETKRAAFARFYFLSNDELISILSQTKDPNAVQPHLRKCFEAVHAITMRGVECEMVDMVSPEQERVPFTAPLYPKGNVENWMGEIETMMRRSVRNAIVEGLAAYATSARTDFVVSHAAMVVLAITQHDWTVSVEKALASGGLSGVTSHYEVMLEQLRDLTALVRTRLTKLQSKTMSALIVMEVHARDVVERLIEAKVSAPGDFEWVSQLRYYWLDAASSLGDENMIVRMVQCSFPYGYEYLGASSRLVITPLTDRCYMTLMGALHIKLGGAPAGPAGTGKTESVKDLAKALAKQCVVFNCSDGLDYKAMGKFFKGLSTAGAWACFDEFNRIDIEVLSVIAQQMLNIQKAIIAEVDTFEFEGSTVKLDPSTATFVTMNPGYAGRTELPDNLKALFRPMAMMVPDYALIAEIRLFSFGFDKSKPLAKKLVSTFRLSSEQLSSQDHYDFGMRAVNTVIQSAGILKKTEPDMDEELQMLRAMRDSNLPKFLRDDILLFRAIIRDLFPGVTEPKVEYAALETQLRAVATERGLQFVPDFLTKCIQLYEMTIVRHGMMLVGPTGAGKSCVLRALQAAMSRVEDDPNFSLVRVVRCNPKAITMNQLYGAFDLQTGEWTDGVAAVLIRHISAPNTEETGVKDSDIKWMVFDGPVDSLWIENMNTVLDDNKKLCLTSGEIIPLSETNRIMFEVEDLAVASPATVSRCGMIYVEPLYLLPDRLEPKAAADTPLIASWLQALPPPLAPHSKTLREWISKYLVPCTELLRLDLTQPVPATMPNVVAGLLRLLDSYLLPLVSHVGAETDDEAAAERLATMTKLLPQLLEPLLVLSLTWSVGGLCDAAGRIKFDAFLRNQLKEGGSRANLPREGTVYDYDFDVNELKWVAWMKTAPAYAIDAQTNFRAGYSSIIVPTAASVCYTSLLRTLVLGGKHTLVVGPTGTAKSVTVQQFLTARLDPKYEPIMMSFSAQTSANQTQDLLDSKFEKRRQGQDKDTGLPFTMWGPVLGKTFAIFIDDLNMPKRERYGAQPPVELIRQLADHGGWYDRKTLRMRRIVDVQLLGAMGPPGGGRQPMSDRVLRHFHMLSFTEMSSETVHNIFTTIAAAFLDHVIGKQHVHLAAPLVQATIDIYNTTRESLRPTPAKPHYTFNLRDVSKVVQGVLMADKRRAAEKEAIVRLWAHEVSRVFADRLINSEDRTWLDGQIAENMKRHFAMARLDGAPLVYCDFYSAGFDPPIYEEAADHERLKHMISDHLQDYNDQHIPMDLVLFSDAVAHICRISRVLRQPSGNALLLGVGGSGRQSLTRMASHIADFQVFQIEITKNYRVIEWREDLKTVLRLAGDERKNTVFLFVDSQIKEEVFLENVNNILSSADVPNLFNDEEFGAIFDSMGKLVEKEGLPATKTNLHAMFVRMVRQHLHVVMCMSPVGEDYRARIRQFPSLINNTTIDWFSPWPPEALAAVARTLMAAEADELDKSTFAGVVKMCVTMHASVRVKSHKYREEMRRHNYVTPTSYLELISMIRSVLQTRGETLTKRQKTLSTGLDKLNMTKAEVAVLKQQLAERQPILEATTKQVMEQREQIAKDKEDATLVQAEAEEASAQANAKAAECKEIKDSAEADLAEALPALDAAVKCLSKLDKSQIVEVKALKKPPAGVRLTLKAVCIMFGRKPEKINDPDNPQKKIEDYWGPSQSMLNSLGPDKFKAELIDFDKENIPESVIKLIDPIVELDEFHPTAIVKVSVACEAMCMWVHAMRKYYYVSREVEPKRQQLAASEKELAGAVAMRDAAEAKLKAVNDRVAMLEQQLQEAVEKMASLEDEVARCKVQLGNADKLIGGLGGEAKSWEEQVKQLGAQLNSVVGDALICAGTISYLGPFTADYRNALVAEWLAEFAREKLPVTKDCSLSKILADPVVVRQWKIDGLPADAFSVENGIIMSRTKRWPLMIDPQGQANRFLKVSQAKAQLKTVKASDTTKKIQQALEMGIRLGQPILLENVLESLDPTLEPILANQTYKDSTGTIVIKLGDTVIPYHSDFRFALTTVMPNPHYGPEVSVKVTLLNFTITPSGLEDQLLVATVEAERPDLAERKNELVLQNAENRRKLQELQEEILYMLSHSEGNILDDTKLIDTLAVSKETTEGIMEAVKEADEAEREIDATRSKYIPVAQRGSTLFFAISDLAAVDSMYQYSLAWFKALFLLGISNTPPSEDLDTRISTLNDVITYALYTNVCRSIFEEHKLMYSFLLAIKILGPKIDGAQWRFLLSGGSLVAGSVEKPNAPWLEDKVWVEVINLAQQPHFGGIDTHLANHADEWRRLYDSATPETEPMPAPWERNLSQFEKLLVLRCLRPDKCVTAIQNFVEAHLGRRFIEPPPFDLNGAYKDSTVSMPLIFILSSGADPVKGLMAYAEQSGMGGSFDYISLGQGQGPKAEKLIRVGKEQGRWVLLMNCHLYVSWMSSLEKEVEEIDPSKTDAEFRLWLTSMPSTKFPVSVLQNGIKMTNEPPKGLRANLRTAIAGIAEERFEQTCKPETWRKVMFGLLLFNAVILERRKFGALGWNIQYQFTDGDCDVCLRQAEMLVHEYETVPYKVISALTADINYGGRVTDDWDRRTISNLLGAFVNADVLRTGYCFSPSGNYRSVDAADKDSYLEYIASLPTNANPEVFGLHENADITCAQNDTMVMFSTILSLQPRAANAGGKSRDEMLAENARDIADKVPNVFSLEAVTDAYPTKYEESMNTVLQQECIRYNRVISTLRASLADIVKALRGEVVMTQELEELGASLFNNQVPEMWARVGYPSLKPLASWVPDLVARLAFVQRWIDGGKPPVFWLSGFYFPQAFITGTLQNHARKYQLPVDTISFGFELRADSLDACEASPPVDGAFVHGLFLEGARWDADAHVLQESRPKELHTTLPVIHLQPIANRQLAADGFYEAPVYKTLSRYGVLSTTGHSTNFVMSIELPSDQPQSHWVRRGVAALLALRH